MRHNINLLHPTEMPSVTFLQYFVLFFDENTSKIVQDLGKYCVFLKFITTHVYCTLGENTVLFIQNTPFQPKKYCKPFCKVGIPDPSSQKPKN